MWIDEGGRAHTVAMPDPTRVMAEDFLVSLDALLVVTQRDDVEAVVEQAAGAIFEQDLSGLSDASYEAVPAPAGLLTGRVGSLDELRDAIERVSLRWRLDAVLHLDDYLG